MAMPKVLILGQAEGTFEQQAKELLSKNQRAQCKIESKNSLHLLTEARNSHFIIMCYQHDLEEERNADSTLLAQLGEHEDQLMLFAENREELMDLLDDLNIHAFRIFKSSSGNQWQKQLLEEIIDWIVEHPPDLPDNIERGTFNKRWLTRLTRTDKMVKIIVSLLVGATTIIAYFRNVYAGTIY